MDKQNIYGSNHPASDDTGEPSIREEEKTEDGVEGLLDTVRERQDKDASGGMGRQETPKGSG
jgi:hypothetical protein